MYNDNISLLGRDFDSRPATPEEAPAYGEIVSNGVPKIKVMGVGGAGNNAVNRMIEAGITSAEFIAVNTDAQVLLCSKAPLKIQIGAKRTHGLGAGADPEVGREAAEESRDAILRALEGTDLLFITAGMGGGTGTGAAPVIAKLAHERNILTVAVVTEPFGFEGRRRMEIALRGIERLWKNVDTFVIIPNEKILKIVPKNASISSSFAVADEVLKQGVRGIADLIVTPGLINVDFADVRTVLKNQGLAHLGVGVAKGEGRVVEAVRLAVQNPLVDTTIEGAKGIIVNIVGGEDFTMDEFSTACELLHGLVDYNCLFVAGTYIDPNIHDEVEVTIIATGFHSDHGEYAEIERQLQQMTRVSNAPVSAPKPAAPVQPAQPVAPAVAQPAPAPAKPQADREEIAKPSSPRESASEEEDKPGEIPAFVRRLMDRKY